MDPNSEKWNSKIDSILLTFHKYLEEVKNLKQQILKCKLDKNMLTRLKTETCEDKDGDWVGGGIRCELQWFSVTWIHKSGRAISTPICGTCSM